MRLNDNGLEIQKDILNKLMQGCNADLPKNITNLFEEYKGTVKVRVTRDGSEIKYDGEIKGKTIGGRILLRSLKSDCIRLAEDIAHFAEGTDYNVKDSVEELQLKVTGSSTWKEYEEGHAEQYADELCDCSLDVMYRGKRLCTLVYLNFLGAKSSWAECEIDYVEKPLTYALLEDNGCEELNYSNTWGFTKDANGKSLPYCPTVEDVKKAVTEIILPIIEKCLRSKEVDTQFYKKLEKLIRKLDNLAEEFGGLIEEAPSKHQEMMNDLYEGLLDQVKLNKTVMLYDDPDSHLHEE